MIKETHRQPIKCKPWMLQQNLKICKRNNGRHLGRFSLTTAAEKQLKQQNTVKSTAFWLSVWKKWCLEKGIAKEIENYEPTRLNTLLERSNAEIKNKHG